MPQNSDNENLPESTAEEQNLDPFRRRDLYPEGAIVGDPIDTGSVRTPAYSIREIQGTEEFQQTFRAMGRNLRSINAVSISESTENLPEAMTMTGNHIGGRGPAYIRLLHDSFSLEVRINSVPYSAAWLFTRDSTGPYNTSSFESIRNVLLNETYPYRIIFLDCLFANLQNFNFPSFRELLVCLKAIFLDVVTETINQVESDRVNEDHLEILRELEGYSVALQTMRLRYEDPNSTPYLNERPVHFTSRVELSTEQNRLYAVSNGPTTTYQFSNVSNGEWTVGVPVPEPVYDPIVNPLRDEETIPVSRAYLKKLRDSVSKAHTSITGLYDLIPSDLLRDNMEKRIYQVASRELRSAYDLLASFLQREG